MLGALLIVHLDAGFFLPNGYEFVLALLGVAVTLALTGAGAYSLDARLDGRRNVRPGVYTQDSDSGGSPAIVSGSRP